MTFELTACMDFSSRKIIVKGGGFFYKVSWPEELKEKDRSREQEGGIRIAAVGGRMHKERSRRKEEDGKKRREAGEENKEEEGRKGKDEEKMEEGKMEEEGERILNEEEIRREQDVRWVKEMREHLEKVLEGVFVSVDEGKLRVLNDKDSFGPVIFKEKIIKKDGLDLDSIIRVVDGKGKVIAGIETILTKSRSK